MFDLLRFLEENRVPVIESGPSVTKGWIAVNCPYCADTLFHMGYNMRNRIFSCWRCGRKPFWKTIELLTGKRREEVKQIIPLYYIESKDEEEIKERIQELSLPKEFGELGVRHKKYLHSRNFDWRQLVNIWGLMGTESSGSFANRIIIPIYYNRKMVTFTSRDITGKSKFKAKACPMDKEVLHAKHLLHGFDLVQGNTVIVTEGPFDTFRFGPGAVNTQGIAFTDNQIELLGAFKNIFICYDSIINDNGYEEEKKAQEAAERLADSLSLNNNVWIIDRFKSDPGDMSEKQIRRIKHTIQRTLEQKERQDVSHP